MEGRHLVIGIGIDLVEIERIRQAAIRTNQRFLERVFTPRERRLCAGRPWRLAGRFAAKEAMLKAMGTGLRGFSWQQIEVLADELGAPTVFYGGNFASALEARGVSRVHVSISHSKEYAIAQVVLEGGCENARPDGPGNGLPGRQGPGGLRSAGARLDGERRP